MSTLEVRSSTRVPSPAAWLGALLATALLLALVAAIARVSAPPIPPALVAVVLSIAALVHAAMRLPALESFGHAGFYGGTFAFFLAYPLIAPGEMDPFIAGRTQVLVGWLLVLNILGFEAGYWLCAPHAPRRLAGRFRLGAAQHDVLLLLVSFGLALWIIDTIQFARHFQTSALTVLLTMRGAFVNEISSGTTIYSYVRKILQSGIYISATAASVLLLAGSRRGRGTRMVCWAVLVACIAVGFLGGSRGQLMYAIAPLAATAWLLVARARISPAARAAFAAGAVVLLIAAWTAMSAMRGGDIREFEADAEVLSPLLHARMAFDIASTMGQVVELVPSDIPFQHGRTLIPVALGWVPRPLWPGKPYPFANSLNEANYETLETRSASLAVGVAAEGYANFGLLGVALWGALLGIGARLLDRLLGRINSGHPLRLQFAIMFGVWIALLVRGGVAEMFYMGLLTIMPPALLMLYLEQAARRATLPGARW